MPGTSCLLILCGRRRFSILDSQLPLFFTVIRSNTTFDFTDLDVLAGVLYVIGTDFCSRKVISSKIQRRSIALQASLQH